jgi:coenzyme PQQ synthesis protein D (PqqD)
MMRYRQASSVAARQVAGELLLVPIIGAVTDPDSPPVADFFVLNGTAETLWGCLSAPQDVQTLARTLITKYGISEAKAEEDALAFVQSLLQIGAIELAEDA